MKRDFGKNLFARQIVLFCIYTTEGVKYFLVDLTISLFYSSREFDTKFWRGNCQNTSHQGTVEGDWKFGVYPKRIGGRWWKWWGPLINRPGSPLRPLTVRETPKQPIHPPSPDRQPPPTNRPATPDRPRQQQLASPPVPNWCKCGCCRQMARALENFHCKKKDCVTITQRFYKLCLFPDILQLYILNRAYIRNDPSDNSTQQFRKAAYRQFILDKYGYLGKSN